MNIVTVVAQNYLPQARALAATAKEHHPNGTVYVFVLDGRDTDLGPHLTRVAFENLEMSPVEFRTRSVIYDVVELATAMKAAVIRSVIRQTNEPVVYLDPDMAVYAPLDDLSVLARDHGIVVTPHSLAPLPEAAPINDRGVLIAGTFNLGFIAVGPQALDFLEWWDERTSRHCLFAPEEGLFFDQRWLDLAVRYFPYHVLRDPGCNVAWWNLPTRRLAQAAEYLVDGRPLRLFHWSGYDPRTPQYLRNRNGSDQLPMPFGPVAELAEKYRARLFAEGYRDSNPERYEFGFAADGSALTRAVRRSFRDEALSGRAPPDPFDPGSSVAFARWSRGVRRAETLRAAFDRGLRVTRLLTKRSATLRHLNTLRRVR